MQKLESPYKTTMQLIYLEWIHIKQYDSISNGYNVEDTVAEVLTGKKVIIKEKIDKQYLTNLIKNNGKNANYSTKVKKQIHDNNGLQNCLGLYLELRQEGYKLNFPQASIYNEFLLNDLLVKPGISFLNKDEYIEQGYFVNGKAKKKPDGSIQYQILITEKGKQFIIEKLELKKKTELM